MTRVMVSTAPEVWRVAKVRWPVSARVRAAGGEGEVAGLGEGEGGVHALAVAHLAEEDDVGVLAQGGAQGVVEAVGVVADLALGDEAGGGFVDVLDGVLDGEDVLVAVAVDLVEDGGEGGGLAAAGGAGDEDEPLAHLGDAPEEGDGEPELLEGEEAVGEEADGPGEAVALEEAVDADAFAAGDGGGGVELAFLHEAVEVTAADEAGGELGEGLAAEGLGRLGGAEEAVDAEAGDVALAPVEVGGAGLGEEGEEGVEGGIGHQSASAGCPGAVRPVARSLSKGSASMDR